MVDGNNMNALWALVLLVGGLLADIFLKQGKIADMEQKISANRYESQDTTLQTQQQTLDKTVQTEEKQIQGQTVPTSVPNLTPDQVTNFWNNKKE